MDTNMEAELRSTIFHQNRRIHELEEIIHRYEIGLETINNTWYDWWAEYWFDANRLTMGRFIDYINENMTKKQ